MKRIRQSLNYKNQTIVSPLLDLVPNAAAAWFFRKLRTAYAGPCIRVRRFTDNAETDIGFSTNGWINETELIAFAPEAGNALYIVTFYDQSGLGNNLITSGVASQQPLVLIDGVPIKQGGFVACYFNGTSNYFTCTPINVSVSSFVNVVKKDDPLDRSVAPTNISDYVYLGYHWNDSRYYSSNGFSYLYWQSNPDVSIDREIISGYMEKNVSGAEFKNSVDLLAITSPTPASSNLINGIGQRFSTDWGKGYFQGSVIWLQNLSAQISLINSNLNYFFHVY